MRLLILLFLFLGSHISNPFIEKFKSYESQEEQVDFEIVKVLRAEKSIDDIKLRKKSYFKIIPPKYEVKTVPVKVIDPSKFTDEMKQYYELVEEQVLIAKGSYKWILTKDDKGIRLTYQYVQGQFAKIRKIVLKSRGCYPSEIKSDTIKNIVAMPVAIDEKRLKAQAKIKDCYISEEREIRTCLSNGTIKKISKEEFYNPASDEANQFFVERGRWRIE